jgi:DNA polymerase-3 subunit gamma/tau
VDDLARHLERIGEQEEFKIEPSAMLLLARKGDGSVRDTLSLLDQVAAFAEGTISEQDVVDALGLVDRQFLLDFTRAVAESNRRDVLQLCRQLFEAGVDTTDFVAELLEHFRLLLLLKAAPESQAEIGIGNAEIAGYTEQAEYFQTGDILRHIKVLSDVAVDLKSGLDERLLIEVAGVKMAEMESTVLLEDVLAQLPDDVSSETAGDTRSNDLFGASEKKSPEPPPVAQPTPEPSGEPPEARRNLKLVSRLPNLAQVKAGWEPFLSRLRSASPMIASQLAMASIRSVTDNSLTLVFAGPEEASMQLVQKPEHYQLIQRVLADHFGANLRVTFELDEYNGRAGDDSGMLRLRKKDANSIVEKSPRLKRLVDKVNGEIIGIKDIEKP